MYHTGRLHVKSPARDVFAVGAGTLADRTRDWLI